MKENVDIKCLYQYARNETVEDLENFDRISYGITEGNYTFRLEDIVS
jgi:hypothetical protein